MPGGRPSTYTIDIADKICERIANGESLLAICRDAEMPTRQCVHEWILRHKEFGDKYTLAREIQADMMAEEILEISDDGRNDWMEKNGEDSVGWALNGEHVARSRLRIDSRKWYAGKVRPRKWGDKQVLEVGGENGGPVEIVRRIVRADATKAGD